MPFILWCIYVNRILSPLLLFSLSCIFVSIIISFLQVHLLLTVFPNYILRFINSFLRSFRFLLFVLSYSIYSLTLLSLVLTVLLHCNFFHSIKHHTIRTYGEWRYNFTHSCPVGKDGNGWEMRAGLSNDTLRKSPHWPVQTYFLFLHTTFLCYILPYVLLAFLRSLFLPFFSSFFVSCLLSFFLPSVARPVLLAIRSCRPLQNAPPAPFSRCIFFVTNSPFSQLHNTQVTDKLCTCLSPRPWPLH